MRASNHLASGILCAFFIIYFAIAFYFNADFPVRAVAGEDSPGTFMSGVLLIISATVSLILVMRHGPWPWVLIFIFFIVLALDEHFMFHESLKQHIIFSRDKQVSSRWLYELPVILGAGVGICMTFMLWRSFSFQSRVLLLGGVLLGTLSVIFDILSAGVFFEECFKLSAELLVACSLLKKVEV